MADATSQVKFVAGYTTSFGNRAAGVKRIVWDNGNYVAGGFVIHRQSYGMRGFDAVPAPGFSEGGNYIVQTQLAGPGASSFKVRLIIPGPGLEVAAGVALTADAVEILAIGG